MLGEKESQQNSEEGWSCLPLLTEQSLFTLMQSVKSHGNLNKLENHVFEVWKWNERICLSENMGMVKTTCCLELKKRTWYVQHYIAWTEGRNLNSSWVVQTNFETMTLSFIHLLYVCILVWFINDAWLYHSMWVALHKERFSTKI